MNKDAKTIYDHRRRVEVAAEHWAGDLYCALKNLLDAVNERNGLRESIDSVTINDATSVLSRIDAAITSLSKG